MDTENQIAVLNTEAERLQVLEQKIDEIYVSVEKTRKYILTSLIITVVVIVLPIVGLIFAVPAFIDSYTSISESGLLEEL